MSRDDTFWTVFIELSRALGDEVGIVDLDKRERIAERITSAVHTPKAAVPEDFWIGLDQAGHA